MTVREYNEWYKKFNNAWSFIHCIDHALQKSDDNAKMQFSVIGWTVEMKEFLKDAIQCFAERTKGEIDDV